MPVSATERTSLLSLFNDLLIVGASLKAATECGEPETLRAHLLDMFYQASQAGGDMGIPKETLRLARYALTAYLDEMVMSSHWPKKLQWPSMSLQNELFSTDLAGQGFFQNLEAVWHGHPLNIDLLELYYLCLVLGCEGKYKLQGREQLKALIQELGRDKIQLSSAVWGAMRPSCQGASPCSSRFSSRVLSSSRVRRTLSSWMMRRKRSACAGSRSFASSRISENARIEVLGVLTSWLTWLRKSSFSTSSRRRRSLACASWPAAASSWRDL